MNLPMEQGKKSLPIGQDKKGPAIRQGLSLFAEIILLIPGW
ncbi:hypothetical protein [Paenibacillus luteus]|nr:hypothetical protein [Paenibacillus luteus]